MKIPVKKIKVEKKTLKLILLTFRRSRPKKLERLSKAFPLNTPKSRKLKSKPTFNKKKFK